MNNYTPRSELEGRIGRLQAHLAADGFDGALILQKADLFYFSGTIQQSHLYIPVEGLPLLMTRRSFERARRESALERVVPLRSPRELLGLWEEHGYSRPKRLGMELDVLPTNLYLGYQQILEGTELIDVSHQVRTVRAIKSPYELDLIRRAAQLADKVNAAVREYLVKGISEVELAGKIEAVARREGHQGVVKMRLWNNDMFYGHLLAGEAAAVPSYLVSPTGGIGLSPAVAQGSSLSPIQRGEPVLCDYTSVWNGYIVDQTRIFAIGGLSDDLRRGHEAMLQVQEAIREAAKPGVTGGELYELAVGLTQRLGYGENFMGYDEDRVNFVGHGVGLELDEYPFLAKGQKMALEEGMVVAVEPKLIFPGVGVVGIEDTHVVTQEGLEPLTFSEEGIVVV
ncbi:MAG: M24 family metallopeptidase [Anaerolineae bacterium]